MFSSFTETYIFRFAAAEVFTVLATSYVYVVVRRCRPGWSRFLLALPVFALNCCVPNLFHNWKETVSKTVFCLSHVWLANFKLAALCLNRGSLIRNWTPVQFFAIFAGPITPRDEVIGMAVLCTVNRLRRTWLRCPCARNRFLCRRKQQQYETCRVQRDPW